jgi:hypothetical protein
MQFMNAAYLRHLIAMPDVELIAILDCDAGIAAKRAAEVRNPPIFTDYRKMLATARPDFVLALGRHRQMAGIAHDLLDQGHPRSRITLQSFSVPPAAFSVPSRSVMASYVTVLMENGRLPDLTPSSQ